MTAEEMLKAIDNVNRDEYGYVGIRFENKSRVIGETITDVSKSNPDRDCSCEFPEYGTDEYIEMDDLNGVSAYNVDDKTGWNPGSDDDVENFYEQRHCYILGSNDVEYGEDENELIMASAKVLAIIF